MLNIPRHFNTTEEYEKFREDALRYLRNNERELRKYQHEYKTLLKTKVNSRGATNVRRSLIKNIEQLRREREDLQSRLIVALAPTHKKEYEKHMYLIGCHAICQDKLNEDIKKLRSENRDLERMILKIDKDTYELKRKTVSNEQHQAHLKKAEKTLFILENQLEMNRKREGSFFTQSGRLRKIIINLLNERALFNKLWRKLIGKLNSDKKYMVDLVEIAIETLDGSVGIYQKLDAIHSKGRRENELRKLEMQNTFRQITAAAMNHAFLIVKGKKRKLDDLEPREYKRRHLFRKLHKKKLDVYNEVVKKVLAFSKKDTIEKAIGNFQQQESLYYSYFTYTNELNYQITILNDGINELYKEINQLKECNMQNIDMDMEAIIDLRAELAKQEASTKLKKEEKQKVDERLERILAGLDNMFRILRSDDAPLMFFLGDHSKMTLFNFYRFLKIIEDRMNKVLAFVFSSQRGLDHKSATVKGFTRDFENPTLVDDIVLAHQCAECAEGEEVNPYDKEFVLPLTKEDVKKKLRVKIIAPEMQYRLHSITECRLPRSRLLASKKQ